MNYYEYNNDTALECENCHWKGSGKDAPQKPFDALFEVWCPSCNTKFFNVPYPTEKETKKYAKKGNREAIDNLSDYKLIKEISTHHKKMLKKAMKLVKANIPGHRKGLPDVPAYLHSLRVYELFKEHSDKDTSLDAHLAALLHDIIEDGGISPDDLLAKGFSPRTVELVKLCSHEETDLGTEARWTLMLAKLITANDHEAWAIKLADLLDNIKESQWMAEEKRRFMVEVKAQLMLKLTTQTLQAHPLWTALEAQMKSQKSVLELSDYWTKDAPYIVYSEDHWDYYKKPPIRPKVGEFSSYIQAVDYCRERVSRCANGEDGEPVSYWVAPEPAGLKFNEHEFLEDRV